MSKSFNCKCKERDKPIAQRNWEITQYRCNHSAFSGYHYTPSDYSTIHCKTCDSWGRTKAAFVKQLYIHGKITKEA